MQYLKKVRSNAKKTYELQEKYFKLTSAVGLIGLFFIAIPLSFVGFVLLARVFGTDSIITISLILPLFFISIPLGTALAALLFAITMTLKGSFTKQEAMNYVRYSEYPKKWFKAK
jgi:hypothetical protein